jgi:signal transduction histidine kinase/DNA-binding response OmpR family regulator
VSELEGLKLLRRIDEGVAGKCGEAFFRQIVRDITGALGAHAAFTSRLLPDRRAVMLAFWVDGRYEKCLEYALVGTPCEYVYNGKITAFARDIGNVFPVDKAWFEELGVNSYLGIPIVGETGEVHGHIAVMDRPERDWHEADVDILRLFSLRTAVELERARAQRQLEESNDALRTANEQLRLEVAQRLAMEQQLAQAKCAAESANQAKSVFISQMSHELRTPLNGILGYAQLLKRNPTTLTERQLDGLDVIERSGEHLLNLVNDLLDLAKIEAGKLDLQEDDVDLPALLQHVGDLARVRADKAGQQFCGASSVGLPKRIRGDARALRQVLLNLLGNAVKFTPAGGRIELRVEPAHEVRQLTFTIIDSGIGMPTDQLTRIFEPFHRINDPTRTTEGTGLGLAITHRLVSSMHGRIDVESIVGRGTTFTVTLPLHIPAAAALDANDSRRIVGYDGRRLSVLVVDDDPVNRSLVATLLDSLGFAVRAANDGREALELLSLSTPDLLITDLVMPHVDGIELTRLLRARRQESLAIIALSASASDYTSLEALQAGCNEFLPKPVKLDLLLDRIGSLLRLEWQVDTSGETIAAAECSQATHFTAVAAHIEELYELAMQGDVLGLVERARELFATNTEARAFYEQLTALAGQYDTSALRRVLASQRESHHSATPRG